MSCNHKAYPDTILRCGKCDKPICPDCMVETPVGGRCRECARVQKLPTFRIGAREYVIATAVGLASAFAVGFIWTAILRVVRYPFTSYVLAFFAGSAIGEVISLSVNRKRGIPLAIIAGLSTVLSYFVAAFLPWGFVVSLFGLLFLIPGIIVAANRLR